VAGSDDRRIAAEHQEFPMCDIDDPHHAENNRQPDADQRQAGNRIKDLDRQKSTRSTFSIPKGFDRRAGLRS
jgi:hypothetical protein